MSGKMNLMEQAGMTVTSASYTQLCGEVCVIVYASCSLKNFPLLPTRLKHWHTGYTQRHEMTKIADTLHTMSEFITCKRVDLEARTRKLRLTVEASQSFIFERMQNYYSERSNNARQRGMTLSYTLQDMQLWLSTEERVIVENGKSYLMVEDVLRGQLDSYAILSENILECLFKVCSAVSYIDFNSHLLKLSDISQDINNVHLQTLSLKIGETMDKLVVDLDKTKKFASDVTDKAKEEVEDANNRLDKTKDNKYKKAFFEYIVRDMECPMLENGII